jgi:hypothetical protein
MSNLIGGALYKNQGNGDFTPINDSSWRNTWDIILSGNFTGAFSAKEQIFYYDAGAGLIRIYQIEENGNLKQLKSINNIPEVWDIIITGSFRGGNKKEFLFYDKTTGAYSFKEINPQGDLKEFGSGHWKTKWDVILSFSYGGQYDSLLFYDKQTGNLKLYTTNGQGNLEANIFSKDIGTNWDIITTFTPFSTSDNPSDSIFFYDPQTGKAKKFIIVYPDYYGFDKEYNIIKNCEIVVAGLFIGANPNLLLYDRQSGTGKLYTHDSAGNLTESKEYAFPTNLHLITSGNFFDMPLSHLLLYGIHNRAIYLDWGGYVDTEFQFSEFFDNPHAIMAWFMPQYPYAYPGPIFAENGSGVYMIGQDRYHEGNAYEDASGNIIASDPVLFMKIGNQKVKYIVPEFKIDKWHHVAVIRKSNNKFRLFINGKPQTPVSIDTSTKPPTLVTISEIDATIISSKPIGKLRFGRRTSLQITSSTNFAAENSYERGSYQAYGFLDDVAVFSKALTGPEVQGIFNKRRLSGSESGLIAFWPFDETITSNGPILKSWKPSTTPAIGTFPSISLVPVRSVTSSRSSDNDSRQFQSLFATNQQTLTLPFPVGNIWHVGQGNNTFNSSHKNTTAFSYDMGPDDPTDKPVLCSYPGKAVYYINNGHCSNTCFGKVDCNNECIKMNQDESRWRNFVKIRLGEGEYTIYQHLGDGSLSQNITDKGTDDSANPPYIPDGFIISEQDAPLIKRGDLIGKIGGDACVPHLHIDAQNTWRSVDRYQTTIPVAFRDYEESTDKINWTPVSRGQLKANYYVRRTK